MSQIHAVVRDRRIDVAAPADLPDGMNITIEVLSAGEKIGLDESEWRDDAEAIADWAAWLDTIEPVEFVTDGAFEEEFRRFNVEAVRRQMFGESP